MNALLLSLALLSAAPARAGSAEDASLERLHAEDPAARERACVDLASATPRGARVYPALALAMDRDLSERVRLAAAKGVITFPGNEALKRAQGFLQAEPGPRNRAELTLALSTEPAHLEDSGATDLISSMLSEDPSPDVRRAAVLGLARRGDQRGLGALRRAAEKDPDKTVRDAARQALAALSAPRPPPSKPAPPKPPKPDAVKGRDACPAPWGWCECDGPIKREPKCLTRGDCRIEVDTVIQLGMPCMWNGLSYGEPN
jgi:HEAT repeat protein